jgi:hypothetical protein
MQNFKKCDLCLSQEMDECYELDCCQIRYCELCMIHLKANNLGKCYKCFLKLSFTKVYTSNEIKTNKIILNEPPDYFKEKIALE